MLCDKGSGKSLLLRAIIASLRKKYSKNQAVISVTASTGMAASNIGGKHRFMRDDVSYLRCAQGMTIHSWGAVTPGMSNIDRQISCIRTCKPAFKRWKDTKVLIVDEGKPRAIIYVINMFLIFSYIVSMVDGELFDTLAKLADQLRNKRTDKPFGGIQVCNTPAYMPLFHNAQACQTAGCDGGLLSTPSSYQVRRGTLLCVRERVVEEVYRSHRHPY